MRCCEGEGTIAFSLKLFVREKSSLFKRKRICLIFLKAQNDGTAFTVPSFCINISLSLLSLMHCFGFFYSSLFFLIGLRVFGSTAIHKSIISNAVRIAFGIIYEPLYVSE